MHDYFVDDSSPLPRENITIVFNSQRDLRMRVEVVDSCADIDIALLRVTGKFKCLSATVCIL